MLYGGTTYVLARTCRKVVLQTIADLVLNAEWNVCKVLRHKLALKGVEGNTECSCEVDRCNKKKLLKHFKARKQVLR